MSPLSGVRVVECSTGIAGAFAGRLLALYGAEVIRAGPAAGDALRRLGPFPADHPDTVGGWWCFLNTGKRSITLDPATHSGTILLRRLLATSHILLHELPPAVLDRLGDVHSGFPNLVATSVSYPVTDTATAMERGPLDLLLQAAGGWMYAMGEPARGPLAAVGPLAQIVAGLYATIAALQGLWRAGGRIAGGRVRAGGGHLHAYL